MCPISYKDKCKMIDTLNALLHWKLTMYSINILSVFSSNRCEITDITEIEYWKATVRKRDITIISL